MILISSLITRILMRLENRYRNHSKGIPQGVRTQGFP